MSETTTATLTCAMCGHTFDPSAHRACQACPLAKGCHLVCCPACGYETVDPAQSTLVRLTRRIFQRQTQPQR